MNIKFTKSLSGWEPFVSVVINFYNEKDNVDMAPACLCEQTYKNFEVIFVDDGSTDGTAEEIIKKYEDKLPNLRIIRNDKSLGLRPARRRGVIASRGDIVITLDLHTIFDKYFIQKIVHFFQEDNSIGAVGPLVLPYGEKWFIKGERLMELLLFRLRRILKGYRYVFGTAAAYKRDLLEQIGFLSESELVEDVDASWKASSLGFKVKISEDPIVYHKSPYNSFTKWVSRKLNDGKRAFIIFLSYPKKMIYPQFLIRFSLLPFLFSLPFLVMNLGISNFVILVVMSLLIYSFMVIILTCRTSGCKFKISWVFFHMITLVLYVLMSSLGFYLCMLAKIFGLKYKVD
jgi:glycosyltransferase involved in cell wall biosynthesis